MVPSLASFISRPFRAIDLPTAKPRAELRNDGLDNKSGLGKSDNIRFELRLDPIRIA